MIDFANLPERLLEHANAIDVLDGDDVLLLGDAELMRVAAREIERLRESLAYNARVIEAQALDLKSLSNRRKMFLADAVERMRAEALGHVAHRDGAARRELDSLKRRESDRKTREAAAWEACTCKAPAGHDVGCASWAVLDEEAW